MSPSVATLTLNPAIDIAYCVKQLIPGVRNASTEVFYDPGGNGINVSRALKLLGIHAHTCCVLAGQSGVMLRAMLEEEVDAVEWVEARGSTRFNCTIGQRRPPEEFKIMGIGPHLSIQGYAEISEKFLDLAGTGYGVMTGSLPDGVPASVYAELSEQLRDRGARSVIDAEGSVLADVIHTRPFLIMPNRAALEALNGISLNSAEAIAQQARQLQLGGAENVAVKLGCEGAALITPDNSYYCTAPKVSNRCSSGSGDALLAGLVAAFIEGKSSEDTLRQGICCGSGTTAQSGSQLFEIEQIQQFTENMEVRQLDI